MVEIACLIGGPRHGELRAVEDRPPRITFCVLDYDTLMPTVYAECEPATNVLFDEIYYRRVGMTPKGRIVYEYDGE